MRLLQLAHKFFIDIDEKLDRETFEDYIQIMRDCNDATYDADLQMWELQRRGIKDCVASLRKSGFVVKVPRDMKEALVLKRETSFVRRSFDESLIVLPPKGDFQVQGIKKGINQNRYLYAYEMGLGKTYIVINVLNHLFFDKKIDKVLIVVPGEALFNWRRELMMFSNFVDYDEIEIATAKNRKPFTSNAKVVICTYRTLLMISDDYYKESHKGKKSTKYRSAQIPFEDWGSSDKAVILDESHCFSYNTKVQTEIGELLIGDIVIQELDVKVFTYNFDSEKVELKKIKNFFTHVVKKEKLLKTSNNNYVTKDHLYYTFDGFKKIRDINEKETMYRLRERHDFKSKILKENLFKRVLRHTISTKSFRKIWSNSIRDLWENYNSKSSILFDKVLCKVENDSEKRQSFREVRLESFQNSKSRNFKQLSASDRFETIEVFNIELHDNKNYFADNILVHNCIKNFKSRQAKILNFHKHYFNYRYLMTGTPTPNGVNEYYNQLNFMDESIIDQNYYSWIKKIANTGNNFGDYNINYFYSDEVEKFIKTIKPWVGRIFTKDVMELPELYIQNIYSHLNQKQLDIYRAVVSSILVSIKDKEGTITTKRVKNQFPFISLALDNPSILKDKFSSDHNTDLYLKLKKWKFKDHSKLPQCDALVSKYIDEGHKIIIWSGHPISMSELADYYKKYNPVVIHGQIEVPKGKDRKEHYDDLLNSFKQDKTSKILIASYIVLSTAVTITEAARSIYFDRNYSSVFWQQSVKRNHRIGQKNNVIVNPILLENSLDIRLDKALNKKVNLNNNLLNNETLSKSEWKAIFEGE